MKPYTIPPSLTQDQFIKAIQVPPKTILASNSKLAKDGISNITMPAHHASVFVNGKLTNQVTCPTAGTCKAICYACQGGYIFKSSVIKHTRNLQFLINDPYSFVEQLNKEIRSKRKLRAIRFNDSGDFFDMRYWNVAKKVMLDNPNVKFYAYTKRVSFFKDLQAKNEIPSNFHVVFSFGGTEDHLIDTSKDRHAKVFSTRKALRAAKYSDGTNTDRLAASGKFLKIGLVVHGNHKALPKLKKIVAKY